MSDQTSDTENKKVTVSGQAAPESLAEAALNYHRYPVPGKLEISATKNMVNQRDLGASLFTGRRHRVSGN